MKTDQVSGKTNIPLGTMNRGRQEVRNRETPPAEKKTTSLSENLRKRSEKAHDKMTVHSDGVKEAIEENLNWTQMRFYRHQEDGKTYVDIINKRTGEVVRTIPEPEFIKIATQFKHLSGMTMNING